MTLNRSAGLSALAVTLIAYAALAAQAVVTWRLTGQVWATLWSLVGYFTVLTNLLVAVSYRLMMARGRTLSAGWLGGLTLWIALVGVVYHLLLARLWSPEGLGWWADQGLHSAVPVLTALWWALFAPKSGLTLRHPTLWLAWPLGFVAYALIRGGATGFYPYPFIDVAALGYAKVGLNAAGLALAFWIGGAGLVLLARGLQREATA